MKPPADSADWGRATAALCQLVHSGVWRRQTLLQVGRHGSAEGPQGQLELKANWFDKAC